MKYTRGPVVTDKSWANPTNAAIKAWYEDMKFAIERSGYTAHLVGASLTHIHHTNEVDIVYTGKLDTDTLEHLLITTLSVGFRHKILIDARWQNNIETAEYINEQITILPTQFIFLNYFEQDYGNGYKIVNDFRLNPEYGKVNDNLVYSTFDRVGRNLKRHQIEYLKRYGKFAHLSLEEYCKV